MPRSSLTWITLSCALSFTGGCGLADGAGGEASSAPASGSPRFVRVETGPPVEDRASTGGVAWVDYDGDGDLDLHVSNGYDVSAETAVPQQNRLYGNDGTGVFTRVDAGPLDEDEGFSSGGTWGDLDNDGDLDLFVPNQQDQQNFLYRNDGGTFSRMSDAAPAADGGHSYSAGWVDADMDGLLDLFVANGGLSHAGVDFLYRNDGEGRFSRVTDAPPATVEGASGGAVWGDADDDGDPDLFVTNRAGNNALYRNEGGWRFTLMEDSPLSRDDALSIAAAWGDCDNDGDLDLYVANMYGMANSLYLNDGTGEFTKAEQGAAVTDGGHSYAVNWVDGDNDGDLDLVVLNWGAASIFYVNDGECELERAGAGDLGRRVTYASSAAWGDYDDDGDQDLYVGSWPNAPGPDEKNLLFRNDSPPGGWLRVRLTGTESNRSAIGARITVRTGGDEAPRLQIREVWSHTGWRSQNSLEQHFGLGDHELVTELAVRWPSGNVDVLSDLEANRVVHVVEGDHSASSR